jgi:hypothetical protein
MNGIDLERDMISSSKGDYSPPSSFNSVEFDITMGKLRLEL